MKDLRDRSEVQDSPEIRIPPRRNFVGFEWRGQESRGTRFWEQAGCLFVFLNNLEPMNLELVYDRFFPGDMLWE